MLGLKKADNRGPDDRDLTARQKKLGVVNFGPKNSVWLFGQ